MEESPDPGDMRCVLEVEQSSGFLEVERRVLKLVAKGASMHDVLDTLTAAIEGMAPKCFCSILLLDEDGKHLRTGAGGSLPAEYMRLVDGLEIGPDVGSCGSAAFRNQTVIVSDIATDYRWEGAKELPMGFGLRACWSVPIRDSKDRVLGTFAMYHRVPATPEPHDLSIVEAGAYLAGNAIERLTADRKLREAVERLRLAEEAAGFGLWDLDIQSDVVTLSEGAAALNGLPRKAARVSGADLRPLIHPDDREANATALEDAIRRGEAYQVEFRLALPDGTQRWCRARGRVERAGDKASRVIGAVIDVTKEKAMLEQLRENERQLAHKQKLESIGELAAGVAHEINTPIQYIGDNAKFLEDAFTDLLKFAERIESAGRPSNPPGISELPSQEMLDSGVLDYHRAEVPKALHELQEGAVQVARIVRAMKEFSHPGPVERQSIDLNHAIESTVLVASHEWKYVAEVSTDFDPELAPIRGIAGEINQVILNLIVNAAHAISDLQKNPAEKGRIDIRTRQDGGFAEIRVSDTGCGIPEAIQSRVFDPFFTTKPVGKGTGQGLALAYAVIVKKHNGTIRVESKPGHGTTFILRLPLQI